MATTITSGPDQLVASKNDAWVSVQTTEDNAIIRMEVYSMPADVNIVSVLAPVDGTKTAIFNLKRILQSMGVVPDVLNYQLPAFNQMAPSVSNNNIKNFFLRFYSVDKTTSQDLSQVDSGMLEVLLAGKNFLNGNTPLKNIIGDGPVLRRFLTCQPAEIKTSVSRQQYLYYFHNENGISTGAANMALKVMLTLNDKSTVEQLLSPYFVSNGQAIILPIGFSQLNLSSYIPAGKTLISYTVFAVLLSDTSKAITNSFTYSIDKRCFNKGKEFIFLNSLGGIDTLFVTDTQEAAIDTTFETAERMLLQNYNVHDGQYYNFFKESFRSFKCTTDLLTYDERLYLQDFFMSTNVWVVTDTDFVPVILTETNYTLQKNRSELQNIQFNFRYAFDEVAYNNF